VDEHPGGSGPSIAWESRPQTQGRGARGPPS
jgi:hypothetical protein